MGHFLTEQLSPWPPISEPEIEGTLRRLWVNRENRIEMRRMLREHVADYEPGWSEERVLRQVQLLLLRQRGGLLARRESFELRTTTLAGALAAEQDEPAPPPPRREVDEHWIAIELVGEDDEPVPGARYEITLPDGKLIRGRLDAQGRAEVSGIEQPGMAQISFVELDQDAWEPLD